jgi:hypothetical protein
MSGCSLPHNCVPERGIAGDFAVENQLSFSTSGLGNHFAVRIVDLCFAVREIWSWNDKRVWTGEQWTEVFWLIAKPAP